MKIEVNGKVVEFDHLPSDDEVDEVASQLGAAPATPSQPAAPTAQYGGLSDLSGNSGEQGADWQNVEHGPTGRAINERVVQPIAGAASRMAQPFREGMGNLAAIAQGEPAQPLTFPGWIQPYLDTATAMGPVLAPELLATGVGVQSGLENVGVSPGMANIAATLTELGLPFAKLGFSGTRGGIGRQVNAAADRATGGTTMQAAGEGLKQKMPAALDARKAAINPDYDLVRQGAEQNWGRFEPGGKSAQQLADLVDEVRASVGADLTRKQADILNRIDAATQSGEHIPYALMDDFNQMLAHRVPLDSKYGSAVEKQMGRVRGTVRNMLPEAEGVAGTPLEGTLRSANQRWATEVGPYERSVGYVANRERTPVQAARRMFSTSDAGLGKRAADLIGADDTATGILARVVETTPKTPEGYFDAGKMATKLHSLSPEVKGLIGLDKTGSAANRLLKDLGRLQLPAGGNEGALVRLATKAAGSLAGTVGGGVALHIGGGSVAGMGPALVLPLAAALGSGSSRLLTLLSRGVRTPEGSKQAAKLATMIATEVEKLQSSSR